MVAGEASGDLHAAGVVDALRRAAPALPIAGVGGVRMRAAGVTLLEDITAHAVMGYAGVLRQTARTRAAAANAPRRACAAARRAS